MVNLVGTRIVITDINFTGKRGEFCGGSFGGTGVNSGLAITMEPGYQGAVNIGPLANGCSSNVGHPYKIKVTIGYNLTIGAVIESRRSIGTIRGELNRI